MKDLPVLAQERSLTIEPRKKRLEVILKVAERCNINCTYCYFFNGADDSFRFHPPSISKATITNVAEFLSQGAIDQKLENIQIDFHGGEPMLLGKKRFSQICTYLQSSVGTVTKLTLCMQTNATLIDSEWVDLFEQHQIHVGVSLDGPAEYHDAERIDFRGKGTYDRVIRGIRLLQEAQKRIGEVGVLCVINPRHSAGRIYRHFVDDLHINGMDFLLPDITHTNFIDGNPEEYGNFCVMFLMNG